MRHRYGARPSTPRAGSLHYRDYAAPPPTPQFIVTPNADAQAVLDQGQTDQCVAYSSTAALAVLQAQAGQQPVTASPPFLYGEGHRIAGDAQEGMQPAWAWDALQQVGACPWALDPPSPTNGNVAGSEGSITQAMVTAAAALRIRGAAIVPWDPGDMASALSRTAVLVAGPVYPAFEQPINVAIAPLPTEAGRLFGVGVPAAVQPGAWMGQALLGYHQWEVLAEIPGAMLADAGPEFAAVPSWYLCQNSWGTGWASGGRFLLPCTYPTQEAWQMTGLLSQPVQPAAGAVVVMTIGSTAYLVDGATYQMDQAPEIDPATGRTLVPVRFCAEALGARVAWNAATRQVTLTRQ